MLVLQAYMYVIGHLETKKKFSSYISDHFLLLFFEPFCLNKFSSLARLVYQSNQCTKDFLAVFFYLALR